MDWNMHNYSIFVMSEVSSVHHFASALSYFHFILTICWIFPSCSNRHDNEIPHPWNPWKLETIIFIKWRIHTFNARSLRWIHHSVLFRRQYLLCIWKYNVTVRPFTGTDLILTNYTFCSSEHQMRSVRELWHANGGTSMSDNILAKT